MDRKENATKLVETIKGLMESDTGLRKSQIKALHQFTDREEVPYRGIFNLATGVGKTRIMSMLALAHLQNNPKSQIVVGVPNTELFEQELGAFQDYRDFQEKQRKKLGLPALGIPEKLEMGVFNQFDKNTTSQIIFTSYHSLENLARRMDTSKVGLLLLDEAHHAVSEKRSNAVNSFTNAFHYGMTATPWYSPERNAENVLGGILAKVDIVDAIKETALAEFKNVLFVSNLSVDLSKVAKTTTGDYDEKKYCEAVLRAMRGNSVNSGNTENWKEAHHYIAKEVAKFYYSYVDENIGILSGKKCLINCRSQEEARIQAQELNKLFGRMVARVHTSDECDSQTIQDFVNGDLPIVCQVGKLTEGFDMPNLDMTINYPTASFVREAQGAARCIRLPKVGSRTPQVTPKKMGLVVDIAFKHPDYDNIVDAIRQNGQVLFQDVVGTPIVQHNDKRLRAEEIDEIDLIKLRKERRKADVERINFTIVSNARELMRLQRDANKLADERYIPPIRPGMRTAQRFGKEFKVDPKTIVPLFEKAFMEHLTFDTDKEKGFPLVEWVKSAGNPCYALHEKGLPAFMEWVSSMEKYRDLFVLPIRPGMRTSRDFKEWKISPTTIAPLFEKAFMEHLTFDTDKEKGFPLVERIKSGTKACYALHEKGLPAFIKWVSSMEKYRDLFVLPIRPGMRTSHDFKEWKITDRTITPLLKQAFMEHLTFDTDKERGFPLVERIKSGSVACYALHEKGLPAFMEWVSSMEKYRDLFVLPIRPGMRTANGFKEWKITSTTITPLLKQAFDEHITFVTDKEKRLPLVERVKSGSRPCYALHEKGLPAFMEWVSSMEKYRDLFIPPIRPGMRTANVFGKEFKVAPQRITPLLEKAFDEHITFDTDKEKGLPLVERVRSAGNPCYALHEKGLPFFKEWLKNKHGIELKEPTTSPTLRSRLKAGSAQGKPKAPPIRKRTTPEI